MDIGPDNVAPTKKSRAWSTFLRWLGKWPVIGHLPNCTKKDHESAFNEFVPTILFSTATFWLTALILRAFKSYDNKTWLGLLYETTKSGQLFIFAVGMLGPILIVSAVDLPNAKQFPGRLGHFAVLLVLGAAASGFYGLVLLSRESFGAPLVNAEYLYGASIAIAAFVLVLRYLTTVYRKNTQNATPEEIMKQPEKDFASEFEARHATDPLQAENDQVDEMIARFGARNNQ